jgi:hypothetical protein
MQCVDVADRLLVDELGDDPVAEQHVASCSVCAHMARGLQRVDSALRASLIVPPPLELQRQLAQIALDAARPQPQPWWVRAQEMVAQLNLASWAAQRPQMIAVQGLATLMLALASWQVFGWLSAFQPVVGDVAYAMELVAASPAVAYLGGAQLDFQSLGIWSVVGMVGWLISENGLVGRRLTSTGLRLP